MPDAEPPKVNCALINPGFTCVEDAHCPGLSPEQLAACGPWACVYLVQPDPDAGIPGKRGCVFANMVPKP